MFWKEYGKTVRRLWLNQFGAVAFGLMLSFLNAQLSQRMPQHESIINYACGVLGAFFYCYLIYLVIWEVGAKDRIRADAGRISQRPHYGLKIGLFYSIPSLAVTFIYLVTTFAVGVLRAESGVLNGTLNVSGLLSLILEAPYVGFAMGIFGNIGRRLTQLDLLFPYGVFWFISCIPAIIVIWLGYWFGYQGKFMSRAYKKKKTQN